MKRFSIATVALLSLATSAAADQGAQAFAARQDVALSLYRSGDYGAAAKIYEQLVAKAPDDPPLLKDLMWVYWYAQRPRDTMAVATRLTTLTPEDLEVWSLLAKAQYGLGERDGLLASCQRLIGLASDNLQVRLDVAHFYMNLKEYEQAEALLRQSVAQFPEELELLIRLARVEFLRSDYEDAARHWATIVERAPEEPSHRYQLALALYYGGRVPDGLLLLQQLLEVPAESRHALDLLTDDALARRDFNGAAQLLERWLIDPAADDESRLMKLAQVYQDMQQYSACLATLQRWLQLNPRSGKALMMQAYVTMLQGRHNHAAVLYRRILRRNPYSTDALLKLGETYQSRGQPGRALQLARHARQLDPTNPYLLLQEADCTHAAGDQVRARRLLTGWLKANRQQHVPVLLYHGLARDERDPMLAAPIHVPIAVFEAHMRALHEAGWRPITAEELVRWHRHHGRLPERAVLITFDDARIESFREGDPILARYNLKATMFAPLANVEDNIPGYASWHQLLAYRDTGRWEIQAHGDQGHNQIQLDAEGHTGLFLPNRMWLVDQGRLETKEEWDHRVREDHRCDSDKLTDRLGKRPVAFAFPEGDFGQLAIPNGPESVPLNLAAAHDAFQVAFYENDYGFNLRSMDPMRLTRMEPRRDWTGDDLLRHLSDQSPSVQMRLRLLQWAVDGGRLREAKGWLKELEAMGVSPATTDMARARILAQEGQLTMADALARSSQGQRVREAEPFRDTMRVKQRPGWLPSIEFFHDNKDRQHIRMKQMLDFGRQAGSSWSVIHSWGLFSQSGFSTLMQHGLGLGRSQAFGPYQQLEIEVLGLVGTGEADTTYSAEGTLTSQWSDALRTEVSLGSEPVGTAQALAEHVADRSLNLSARWNPDGPLSLAAAGWGSSLSDDNARFGTNFEVAHDVPGAAGLRAVYKLALEDSRETRLAYYTPRHLMTHQLGLEYPLNFGEDRTVTLRYLPGFGRDDEADAGFVQWCELRVPWKWTPQTSMLVGVVWEQVPSYRGSDYEFSVEHRF